MHIIYHQEKIASDHLNFLFPFLDTHLNSFWSRSIKFYSQPIIIIRPFYYFWISLNRGVWNCLNQLKLTKCSIDVVDCNLILNKLLVNHAWTGKVVIKIITFGIIHSENFRFCSLNCKACQHWKVKPKSSSQAS